MNLFLTGLTVATGLFAYAAVQAERVFPHDYPPITGNPAYNYTCVITHEWEDGSAVAYCPEDGETYAYDADGGFIVDIGIKFFYRPEGSWYVAPEILQVGPGAPIYSR